MRKTTLIVLCITLIAGFESSLWSGELSVITSAYPKNTQLSDVTVVGEGVELTKKPDGSWDFHMSSPDLFQGSLVVSLSDTAKKYDTFNMKQTVPYFWDGEIARKTAAAVVSGDVLDPDMYAFLYEIGSGPTALNDIVLVHERAVKFWTERESQLELMKRPRPNGYDVRVAYWVLETARDLMVSEFVEFDDETRKAEQWIKGIRSRPNDSKRLLNNSTVTEDTVDKILTDLRWRDAFVYNQIAQRFEHDLKTDQEKVCPRIKKMDAFFSSMNDSERETADATYGTSLKLKVDSVICTTLNAAIEKANGPASEFTRADVTVLVNSAQEAVIAAKNSGKLPVVRKELKLRLNELQNVIDK